MNTQRTILCHVSNSQWQKQLTQLSGGHFESSEAMNLTERENTENVQENPPKRDQW